MTGLRLGAYGLRVGAWGLRLEARGLGRAGLRLMAYGCRVARGLLSELSDQRAYARHLEAHGRAHSAVEWQRFSDERLRAKFERPKCC